MLIKIVCKNIALLAYKHYTITIKYYIIRTLHFVHVNQRSFQKICASELSGIARLIYAGIQFINGGESNKDTWHICTGTGF
jgi:hypothetical protein